MAWIECNPLTSDSGPGFPEQGQGDFVSPKLNTNLGKNPISLDFDPS